MLRHTMFPAELMGRYGLCGVVGSRFRVHRAKVESVGGRRAAGGSGHDGIENKIEGMIKEAG